VAKSIVVFKEEQEQEEEEGFGVLVLLEISTRTFFDNARWSLER
jgi:hypothetical protein